MINPNYRGFEIKEVNDAERPESKVEVNFSILYLDVPVYFKTIKDARAFIDSIRAGAAYVR